MRREEGWSSRGPGRWPVWPELSEQTGLQGQQGGARPLRVRERGAHNAEHTKSRGTRGLPGGRRSGCSLWPQRALSYVETRFQNERLV